jgi:DNA integrity scanning protein DisA with diadenylate cyclase activity
MNALPDPPPDVRPDVLRAALDLGRRIGDSARRGRRVGALFIIGDCARVLHGSRQLVPNPLHGHPLELRMLTDPALRDMFIELSKLDGAFVVRRDGYVESAATCLAHGLYDIAIPPGLGARHVTAAAVSARTNAAAIAVSASDGGVRLFMHGELIPHSDNEPFAMSRTLRPSVAARRPILVGRLGA